MSTFGLRALLWVTSPLCDQSSHGFEDATPTNAQQVFVPLPALHQLTLGKGLIISQILQCRNRGNV